MLVGATTVIDDHDVFGFVGQILGSDDQAASDTVRSLIDRGVAVDGIYLDLLAPAARQLGLLWEDDECSFIDVTLGMGRLQRIIRDLSHVFQTESPDKSPPLGHVLLTCLPGEQHTLGLIMVAEFLIRDGFKVYVGAPWSEADLLTLVSTEWFDVVGFSAGCESRLSALKREIHRIRGSSCNPDIRVLVGGQVFSVDEALVARVGADGWARDAKTCTAVARNLCGVAP